MEKGRYGKSHNLARVAGWLEENYPDRSIGDFCREFGYNEHITALLTLDESGFKSAHPDAYGTINRCYDNIRTDVRTPYEAARDICSNFIMEDIFSSEINRAFPWIKVSTNEEEERDIDAKPTNLPDFIFENEDTGKSVRFDLKIDWSGKAETKRKFFFRRNERHDYGEYGALALIWCPTRNKFTFVDFRKFVAGEEGKDASKGNKDGFWADLEKNLFEEMHLGRTVFLNHMVQRLDKLSKK